MRFWFNPFGKAASRPEERRTEARLRVRLRPAKLVDAEQRFVADCAIVDRSRAGLRLRFFAPVAVEAAASVAVLDEREGTLIGGALVWQTRGEAGFRGVGAAAPAEAETRRRVAGPYYAVPD